MAKNKKRSLAAKKAAKKAWATRRANANKASTFKINPKYLKLKALDGPLLEINAENNPEPGPAVGTMGTEANQPYSLRDTVAELDKLLARLYSLLG